MSRGLQNIRVWCDILLEVTELVPSQTEGHRSLLWSWLCSCLCDQLRPQQFETHQGKVRTHHLSTHHVNQSSLNPFLNWWCYIPGCGHDLNYVKIMCHCVYNLRQSITCLYEAQGVSWYIAITTNWCLLYLFQWPPSRRLLITAPSVKLKMYLDGPDCGVVAHDWSSAKLMCTQAKRASELRAWAAKRAGKRAGGVLFLIHADTSHYVLLSIILAEDAG